MHAVREFIPSSACGLPPLVIRFLVVVVIGDRVVSSLNQLDRIFVSSFDQAGYVFTTGFGEKVSRARGKFV